MSKGNASFRLTFSSTARNDVRKALQWSLKRFGREASIRYSSLLDQAFRDLLENPDRPGSRVHSQESQVIRTYHLSSSRRRGPEQVKKPRHVIIYRVRSEWIDVARVIYDSSDLERHVASAYRM